MRHMGDRAGRVMVYPLHSRESERERVREKTCERGEMREWSVAERDLEIGGRGREVRMGERMLNVGESRMGEMERGETGESG